MWRGGNRDIVGASDVKSNAPDGRQRELPMTTEKLAIEGGTPLRAEPFGSVHSFGEPELDQLMQVVDDAPEQWHSGYKVREFEDGFARRHGVGYAVATDSGTGAIHAAVAAVDPGAGRRDHHGARDRHRLGAGHHAAERHPRLLGLGAGRGVEPGRRRHRGPDHRAHQGNHGHPPVRRAGRHGSR